MFYVLRRNVAAKFGTYDLFHFQRFLVIFGYSLAKNQFLTLELRVLTVTIMIFSIFIGTRFHILTGLVPLIWPKKFLRFFWPRMFSCSLLLLEKKRNIGLKWAKSGQTGIIFPYKLLKYLNEA